MIRLLTFILCALTLSAQAANWYINPNGINGGATSWTDCTSGFSGINWANVNPGDTIWVSGGTIGGANVTKSGTIGARISIVRATAANHGTSTGWNNSMEGQVVANLTYGAGNAVFRVDNHDYITIDGQAWPGFRINFPVPTIDYNTQTASQVFGVHGAGNSNIVQYVECAGPGVPSANTGVAMGDNNAYGRKTFFQLAHCYFHGLTVNSQLGDTDQMLVEQNEFGPVVGNSVNHDNSIYFFGLNDNGVIRNNYLHDNCAVSISITALRPPGPNHVKIYGNVWWGTRNVFHFDANQGPAWQLGGDYQIYNNTFVNCTDLFRVDSRFSPTFTYSVTGGFVTNNIVWNATSFSQGPMLHDYNFNDANLFSEPHGITGVLASPFVSLTTGDLHITSAVGPKLPRGKGTIVIAETSPDKDGVLRATPPSIGAYEAAGAAPPLQPPAQPVNFTPGNGAANVSTMPQLTASTYSDPQASPQVASQWIVTDLAGTTTYWDSGQGAAAVTTITVPGGKLSNGSSYAWKVRYGSQLGLWSPFSTPTTFATVALQAPVTPVNVTPANNATSVTLAPTLTASAYSDPQGSPQLASQWQLSSGGVLIWDVTTNAAASFPAATSLTPNTVYIWRVRYESSLGLWSAWSGATAFTTLPVFAPATPSNVTPAAGAVNVTLTPTLSLSAYSDPNAPALAQLASEWLIRSNAVTIYDAIAGAVASKAVPAGVLTNAFTYTWTGRYQNISNLWSGFSVPTAFTTTNAAPVPPPLGQPVTITFQGTVTLKGTFIAN